MQALRNTILAVDDSASMRQILAATLDEAGYAVTTARDGQEALALASNASFDLVLTDQHMPGMDGLSLIRALRDLDAFAHECAEAAAMGFDGKTLIHPAQVDAANRAFAPSPEAIAEALMVKEAFALAENAGKGVISLNGKMVERLHLAQAEKLLAKAAAIGA